MLLAIIAAMYASYHGAEGLKAIAQRVHQRAAYLAAGLQVAGIEVVHDEFFDTSWPGCPVVPTRSSRTPRRGA